MREISRTQARVALPDEFQRKLNPIRKKWGPDRAVANPAHVTLVYHDEAPDVEMLEARLRTAVRGLAPFRLVVGEPERFQEPCRGAFLTVSDPFHAISKLRDSVLRPPFVPRERFGLHVTILHPDDGVWLEQAWRDIMSIPMLGPFDASAVQLVDSRNRTTVEIEMSSG